MKNVLTLQEINRRAKTDAVGFVQEESARFAADIGRLTENVLNTPHDRLLIMLSGPSSSGKTTTASMLTQALAAHGVESHVVSIDDFYRGRGMAPVLEDGSLDYEALEALDVPAMQACLSALLDRGEATLPIFDFVEGKPSAQTRTLTVSPHAAVIFEGIHAINPIFEQHIARDRMIKLFVNPDRQVYHGEDVWLSSRQLRLTRRTIRDNRFRNSGPDNTLVMWPQVVRGENRYMFPFVDTVDYRIDTTHAFEFGVFMPELLSLLQTVSPDHPALPTALALRDAMQAFEPIDPLTVPRDSLLREFLGDVGL